MSAEWDLVEEAAAKLRRAALAALDADAEAYAAQVTATHAARECRSARLAYTYALRQFAPEVES